MNINRNLKKIRQKINGIRVRSNCKWYEDGRKVNKAFSKAFSRLTLHLVNGKDTNEPQEIRIALYDFYQFFFKEKLSLYEESLQSFLDKLSLPKLNNNQAH